MVDYQLFPSPLSVTAKASAKFQRPIARLLEPSGGKGDLLNILVYPPYGPHQNRAFLEKRSELRKSFITSAGRHIQEIRADQVDCVEIDLNNCAILRSKGYSVVGTNFLDFHSPAIYSHILMNPPFAAGAEHVIHAWNNILRSGELVAILNAETLRNPYSQQRQLLARIVKEYSASEPEYLEGEFDTDETERRTSVEVVIIHLEKKSSFNASFINGLRKEQESKIHGLDEHRSNEVMLPANELQNIVLNFNCAVESLKIEAIALARLDHYRSRLGRSLLDEADLMSKKGGKTESTEAEFSASVHFNTEYAKLKQKAWTRVLRSSRISDRLSSAAQRRMEEEFEIISTMEFTMDNVTNFLGGIIEQAGKIQREMVCDVFDLISRYAPENRYYYMGWKSNAKHRTNAFRIKTTRFILPVEFSGRSLSWNDRKIMSDFDKVFSMLDGKAKPEHGIEAVFNDPEAMSELRTGGRVSSDYFDVRCYFGRGTAHFFPKRADLIDRLNQVVGKHRQWLPEQEDQATPAFWEQYNKADKINAALDIKHIREYDLRYLKEEAMEQLDTAYAEAMKHVGIEYDPNSLLDVAPGSSTGELLALPLPSDPAEMAA